MVAVWFHLKPLDLAGKPRGHLFGQQSKSGVNMPRGQHNLQRPDDFPGRFLDQRYRHAGIVEDRGDDAVIRPQHGITVVGPVVCRYKGAVRRKNGEGPVSNETIGDILDKGIHHRRYRKPVHPHRTAKGDAWFCHRFSAATLIRFGGGYYRRGQTLYPPSERHCLGLRRAVLLAKLFHQELENSLAGAGVSHPRIGRHGGAVGFLALRLDLQRAFGKRCDVVRTGAAEARQLLQKRCIA